MNLDTPLSQITGIGPNFIRRLQLLNLFTIGDLLTYFPFRYDDFTTVSSAGEAPIGQKVTLQGEIWSIKNIYTRTHKIITQAIFNDGTTPIELTWFNSAWLTKQIQVGDKVQVSGKLTKYKNKLTIVAPVWEKTSGLSVNQYIGESDNADIPTNRSTDTPIHTGRLVPVYSETFGLTSKWLRTKIAQFLPRFLPMVQDPLPIEVKGTMLNLPEAIQKVHFPDSWPEVNQARKRLGFDELFFIQLATLKTRSDWQKKLLVDSFDIKKVDLKRFLSSLPFKLTPAQLRVTEEIIEDLKGHIPMNRLVQGEVGSGKTVVAAAIAYLTFKNNLKTLYMAPTEILAFQHYSTLQRLLEPFGITIGIYTGSRKNLNVIARNNVPKQSSSNKTLSKIATNPSDSRNDGEIPDIIVGTHALLSEKLAIDNVGLIIVDEQQRFGVEQRALLRSKAKVPHFLTMTATPIPRTVALTLYGDLDLSIINELPRGRKPVKTFVVPSKKRADAYQFIAKKVKAGDQVYIVTPLIEASETNESIKAVKVEFERLKTAIFPDLRLGLLHGRLKAKEKEAIINAFKDHQIDILVSTSVVEVGVDVSNATIMMIEGAERFGLSQLHQLRGRVGRGGKESFCLLFTSTEDKSATSRLKNLETTFDGLKLAELDLKIRGSGELFGTRQSGRFELKIASFSDLELIEKTRTAAREILDADPTLDKHPTLQAQLQRISANAMPD